MENMDWKKKRRLGQCDNWTRVYGKHGLEEEKKTGLM